MLYHFTELENLTAILKSGYISAYARVSEQELQNKTELFISATTKEELPYIKNVSNLFSGKEVSLILDESDFETYVVDYKNPNIPFKYLKHILRGELQIDLENLKKENKEYFDKKILQNLAEIKTEAETIILTDKVPLTKITGIIYYQNRYNRGLGIPKYFFDFAEELNIPVYIHDEIK